MSWLFLFMCRACYLPRKIPILRMVHVCVAVRVAATYTNSSCYCFKRLKLQEKFKMRQNLRIVIEMHSTQSKFDTNSWCSEHFAIIFHLWTLTCVRPDFRIHLKIDLNIQYKDIFQREMSSMGKKINGKLADICGKFTSFLIKINENSRRNFAPASSFSTDIL